jgi:hypothetical protein
VLVVVVVVVLVVVDVPVVVAGVRLQLPLAIVAIVRLFVGIWGVPETGLENLFVRSVTGSEIPLRFLTSF